MSARSRGSGVEGGMGNRTVSQIKIGDRPEYVS